MKSVDRVAALELLAAAVKQLSAADAQVILALDDERTVESSRASRSARAASAVRSTVGGAAIAGSRSKPSGSSKPKLALHLAVVAALAAVAAVPVRSLRRRTPPRPRCLGARRSETTPLHGCRRARRHAAPLDLHALGSAHLRGSGPMAARTDAPIICANGVHELVHHLCAPS